MLAHVLRQSTSVSHFGSALVPSVFASTGVAKYPLAPGRKTRALAVDHEPKQNEHLRRFSPQLSSNEHLRNARNCKLRRINTYAKNGRGVAPLRPKIMMTAQSITADYNLDFMIGYLRGQLVDKRTNQVLVDVNGVGYQVSIPLSTFYALGDLRADVTLLVHTHLREDSITLYGFLTAREKQFFELLISASGVGPSLALKILSGMNVEELLPAIRANDLVRLTRIPGVGRKTAERIVVELRDKLAAMEPPQPERVPAAGRTQLESDVVSALLNLGYDRRLAEKALDDIAGDGGKERKAPPPESFEALLRATLQHLSAKHTTSPRA